MSRTFAPITIAELKKKIEEKFTDKDGGISHQLITQKLGKDIKVKFDFENFEYNGSSFGPKTLLGYKSLDSGLTFLGMVAGGEWEHPVYFLLYWSGKAIRGYVPTEGNPWNTTTNQAYGNDEVADLKNAKKRWPELYKDATEVEGSDFEFDTQAIRNDIKTRILPLASKKDIGCRINELTFYGTGDEAYKLFQQACSFCYNLVGLGSTDCAETVYKMAEEMATESKKYWDKENPEIECEDIAKGHFG